MLPRVPLYYPLGIEREYIRLMDSDMAMLGKALETHLPGLFRAMSGEPPDSRRDEDGGEPPGLYALINDVFSSIQRELEQAAGVSGTRQKLWRIARGAQSWSVAQWRRVVRDTLGINILEDYYRGEFFRHMLTVWVDRNVGLIKTARQHTLGELREIVLDGWRKGQLTRDIASRIQGEYKIGRHRAQFWARDQTAKLNADLARQQQEDAGVEEYVWATSVDERVRGNPKGKWPDGGDHYSLEGRRYSWTNPPVVDKRTGRVAHPGKDYNCRCVALPVFNLPGLSLPWERSEQQ